MGRNAPARRYRFETAWTADASPAAAFAVLEAIPAYPEWWPDVRAVPAWDEEHAIVLVRAVLPYTLRLRLRRERSDPAAGILQVEIRGDLEGHARWTIRGGSGGLRLEYVQETDLRAAGLRRWEPLGAPLFRANHAAMMLRG